MSGTIQRKLLAALVGGLLMLVLMAVSGITGLVYSRNVLRDFDYAINQAPHKAELEEAMITLFGPLQENPELVRGAEAQKQAIARQQAGFALVLESVKKRFLNFRRRVSDLSTREVLSGRKVVSDQILGNMQNRLYELQMRRPASTKLEDHQAWVARTRRTVAQLSLDASHLPDPVDGLQNELATARRAYRISSVVLIGSAVIAIVLLGLIASWGYYSVYKPLQELHRGARRVANNDDFNFRLKIRTRDEMAELAEAFNSMTARFQEAITGRDREVDARSQQLVRSDRLAGVGFLAAGVAHEINNPLNAISMAAESLLQRAGELEHALPENDAAVVRQYLSIIQNEAERCSQITSKLLNFARAGNQTRLPGDLTQLIHEVCNTVQLFHLKNSKKQVVFERTQPCIVEMNQAEIKQVILNLIANAIDSLDDGGTLRISLTDQTDQVIVAFEDNGCGMTPEVVQHLFDPFFTQKRGGQGTGLGLSICDRIAKDHGGSITPFSRGPGQGSTFELRLPRKALSQTTAA